MVERQRHGFDFEQTMDELISSMQRDEGYTAEDDAHLIYDNTLDIRTSVKTCKYTMELCLGSFSRIATNDEPLLLFIGHYQNKRDIHDVDVLYLEEGFTTLFGENRYDLIDLCADFVQYMTTTPDFNAHSYDVIWKEKYNEFREEYEECSTNDCYIFPRAKRDHKKQKRMQCAIAKEDKEYLIQQYSIASFDLKLFTFYTPHDDQEYQYSSYEELKEVIEDFLYEWATNNVY